MNNCENCIEGRPRIGRLAGVTRTMRLAIFEGEGVPTGTPQDLTAQTVVVRVLLDGTNDIYVPDFVVEGTGNNVIKFVWPANRQAVGNYTLDVMMTDGGNNVNRVNWHGKDGIRLVQYSNQVYGEDATGQESGEAVGLVGYFTTNGVGMSAFDEWRGSEYSEGYPQTVAGFMAYLRQPATDAANAARQQMQQIQSRADEDHTRAGNDHSTAESDHGTASSDHTRAAADHTTATGDHTRAEEDHTRAISDHTRAAQDHTSAVGDHMTAGQDHLRAEADHTTAGSDHTRAESDHATAASDHTTAASDHTKAGQDSTRAGSDHDIAVADHAQTEADHTRAEGDHTLAASDHSTAAEDHTQALADHAVVEGYDTRLTNVETDVNQLGQKVDGCLPVSASKLWIPYKAMNAYANLQNISVGDTYTPTLSGAANYAYWMINCAAGDVFKLKTSSNTASAKAYAILDSNNKVLDIHQSSVDNQVITIPTDGVMLIVNTLTTNQYEVSDLSGRFTRMGYKFEGIATPNGTPTPINQNSAFFAKDPGTYTNYGNQSIVEGEYGFLLFDVASGWSKATFPDEKLIELKGFGTSGTSVGATSVGDVYFNTNSRTLQRKFRLSGDTTFETLPFRSGAIYQYGDDLYTWDGANMLVHKRISEDFFQQLQNIGADEAIALSTASQSIPCNQGVGNVCPLTPQASESGFHYAVVDCSPGDSFEINGAGASSARLWCFLTSADVILSVADANVTDTHLILHAPASAAKLLINSNNGGINYKRSNSGLYHDVRDITERFDSSGAETNFPLNLRVTPNLNGISSNARETMCLCGLKTAITTDKMPYTQGLLWHKYPSAADNKLYFSSAINERPAEVGIPSGWALANSLFAISPKDGRIISTKKDTRGGICIFDGDTTTILPTIGGVAPCGWLYNSGVDFINDGEDEYCIFAEYSYTDVYYVWRGKYPYTSESDWEIVMTKRGPTDSNPEITHFHTIRRDPWTDILYCTSGDYIGSLFWWYSTDKGETWTLLTNGSSWENHCARNIGFIFTKDYIYWATDYGENHTFNRIKRDSLTGVIDISTREKVCDLPYGQATNSICYHEKMNGVFFYERLDSGFQSNVRGYYDIFYSFKTEKLYKFTYHTLNEEDYQTFTGLTNNAWGGNRGKCYVNHANLQIGSPAMGFSPDSPCLINMIGENNMNIGTIYYD